ncbi:MAG TPA: response regulator transcription factor [Puia sp.]|jgi:two-component system NarL family response regulator|nr:response regulator transcription factor [Puia sp.]
MGPKGIKPVHVLIADQNCIVRTGIKVLLMETRSWQCFQVTEARSTEQAIALLSETAFDIVLLECGLPGIGGIKATSLILSRWPRTAILGISHDEDCLVVERMVNAGARGIILNNVEADMLAFAIRTVMSGQIFYSSELAVRLMERMKGIPPNGMERLTVRERQIFGFVMEGIAGREIGSKLGIAKRTVDKHLQHINHKLGTRSPLELVQAGLRMGLVKGWDEKSSFHK